MISIKQLLRIALIIGLIPIFSECEDKHRVNNTPPVSLFNLESNDKIFTNDTIVLDASNSYDNNGDSLHYIWKLISQPENSLSFIQNPSYKQTYLVPDLEGWYVLSLLVKDQHNDSSCMIDSSFVNIKNYAPVAVLPSDSLSCFSGDTLVLDGTGSFDENGDPLTYIWTLKDKPTASTSNIPYPSNPRINFIPDAPGLYCINLTVYDIYSKESKIDVIIEVKEADLFKNCNCNTIQQDKYAGYDIEEIYFDDFLDKLEIVNGIDNWEIYNNDNFKFEEEGSVVEKEGSLSVFSGKGLFVDADFFATKNLTGLTEFDSDKYLIEFRFEHFIRGQYFGYGMGGSTFHRNSEFEITIGNSILKIRPGTEQEYYSGTNLFSFTNKIVKVIINDSNKEFCACTGSLDISDDFIYSRCNSLQYNFKISSSEVKFEFSGSATTTTKLDYLKISVIK